MSIILDEADRFVEDDTAETKSSRSCPVQDCHDFANMCIDVETKVGNLYVIHSCE